MPLTAEVIQAAPDDEALLALLSAELNRLLPRGVLRDRELYLRVFDTLPPGLRAMAGMHFFDVSMAIDDLAWHFGNQFDEGAISATLNGLKELELYEVADLFEQARRLMNPYIETRQKDQPIDMDATEWSERNGVDEHIRAMDRRIREIGKNLGKSGLMTQWPIYARKYPERCVVADQPS